MTIQTGDGIGHQWIAIIIMTFHQIMIIIGMIGKVIIGVLMIVMVGGVIGMKRRKETRIIKIGGMMMGGGMRGLVMMKSIRMMIMVRSLHLLLHQLQVLPLVRDLSLLIQIVLLKLTGFLNKPQLMLRNKENVEVVGVSVLSVL